MQQYCNWQQGVSFHCAVIIQKPRPNIILIKKIHTYKHFNIFLNRMNTHNSHEGSDDSDNEHPNDGVFM